ncbi:MAG: TVP38/TMEM64 family protein [Acidobacteria bacterium]|nr:MAG: TVP38/TMEM64 family protein [Acidobacteriota bacterium]
MRHLPPRLWGRLAVLAALLAGGLLLLRWPPVADQLTEENVRAVLERLSGSWWAPLALIALYVAGAPLGLPVSPMVFAGGAVFGAGAGTLYNVVGLLLGAGLSFAVAHRLGRDVVAHLVGTRSLQRAERVFDRRGFWPLVQIRFVPLPFALVNYGAALAGVKPRLFIPATAAGILPTTVMHTFFAAWLARAPAGQRREVLLWYAAVWAAAAFLTTLPTLRQNLRRRRRYRELTARRRARRGPG